MDHQNQAQITLICFILVVIVFLYPGRCEMGYGKLRGLIDYFVYFSITFTKVSDGTSRSVYVHTSKTTFCGLITI